MNGGNDDGLNVNITADGDVNDRQRVSVIKWRRNAPVFATRASGHRVTQAEWHTYH